MYERNARKVRDLTRLQKYGLFQRSLIFYVLTEYDLSIGVIAIISAIWALIG